jgi:hypothetical protein
MNSWLKCLSEPGLLHHWLRLGGIKTLILMELRPAAWQWKANRRTAGGFSRGTPADPLPVSLTCKISFACGGFSLPTPASTRTQTCHSKRKATCFGSETGFSRLGWISEKSSFIVTRLPTTSRSSQTRLNRYGSVRDGSPLISVIKESPLTMIGTP